MSKTTKIVLCVMAVSALLAMVVIGMVISVNNTCIAQERSLDAQYEQNQNNLASYTNKILDLVQVPKMAKDHIRELTTAAIQGRYGNDGSKALFHAVQEQNPTVDASLYQRIMQEMSAGRTGFEADQKMMIDKCRTYDTYVGQFPQNVVAGVFGYPRYDKSKCKPVITDDTAKSFQTKRTGPIAIN